VWRPRERPDPPIVTQSTGPVQTPEPDRYHLVRANFTPWITTKAWSWSDIRRLPAGGGKTDHGASTLRVLAGFSR
jgi:hypothetical protein